MKVTVFGATGGIGRRVVEELLWDGHEVTVLFRDSHGLSAEVARMVRVVRGELPDGEAIDQAVEGAEAVVWAVGPTSNTPGQPTLYEAAAARLVRAMVRRGIRRLIALSGAAVTMPGERKPLAGRLMSWVVGRAVRHVVATKERELAVFTASGLDWTLVRPPRVVDGAARGGISLADQVRSARVTQGDVAAAIVALLRPDGARYVHRAPYVA